MSSNAVVKALGMQPDLATIEKLEELLRDARSGALVGLVAAVHYGSRDYSFIGSGSLVTNPDLGIAATVRLTNCLL